MKYSISETRKCGLSDGTNHRPRQFFFRLSRLLSSVLLIKIFKRFFLPKGISAKKNSQKSTLLDHSYLKYTLEKHCYSILWTKQENSIYLYFQEPSFDHSMATLPLTDAQTYMNSIFSLASDGSSKESLGPWYSLIQTQIGYFLLLILYIQSQSAADQNMAANDPLTIKYFLALEILPLQGFKTLLCLK